DRPRGPSAVPELAKLHMARGLDCLGVWLCRVLAVKPCAFEQERYTWNTGKGPDIYKPTTTSTLHLFPLLSSLGEAKEKNWTLRLYLTHRSLLHLVRLDHVTSIGPQEISGKALVFGNHSVDGKRLKSLASLLDSWSSVDHCWTLPGGVGEKEQKAEVRLSKG
ncbi:hypothetical protein TorRG33x02_047040, partial [Trema orientale]